MTKILNIMVFAFAITEARVILSRRQEPMVQLYSPTGVHMSIRQNGRVASTNQHKSPLGVLQLEQGHESGVNFRVKGVVSGLYLKIHRKRIVATKDKNAAALFEENVEENMFNTYNIVGQKNCKIVITGRGAYRVKCLRNVPQGVQLKRMSFLPRKAHLTNYGTNW